MSALSPKDRVSLCLFSFTDGRRCRTPRTGHHPHFCFYHAQKESQTQAAEKLGKDLAYFFSGDYLSACDLSTALARLIPAVVRGDIKPRLARTVAYMFQTQLQAIHLSQHEYINAFSTDGWRKAVRTSVNANHDYLFPPDPEPAPEPQQPAPPARPQTQTQQRASAPAPSLQARTTPAPAAQSPTLHTATSLPRASFPVNQSAVANAQPSRPNSTPPQSVEHTVNPAAHTPQPASSTTQPTEADAALSVARSMFRRRPSSASVNSFRTNIYTPPRNY
ncbi:MAG: hypothetical protein ACYDCG_03785 [Candidatus Acidiferrales bacterium]